MNVVEYAELMTAAHRRALALTRSGKHTESIQIVMFSSYVQPPSLVSLYSRVGAYTY